MKQFEFGPFLLNEDAIRLTKDGQEIELEPQVFDALLLLVKNNQRVVTKEEMLNELWQGRPLTDHVITRIIYELRKVLGDKSSEQPYIRTVRGKGYQFVYPVVYPDQSNQAGTDGDDLPEKKQGFKQTLVWSTVAVLLVILVWLIAENDQPTGPVTRAVHPIITVLPIDVQELSDEVAILSVSIIDQMVAQLRMSLNMRVIHPDNLQPLKDQFHDLWAIQSATRADYIITSQIDQFTASAIKIRFDLHQANPAGVLTPYTLGSFMFPYPHSAKELKELYKQQRVTVREIIQLIKPGVTIRTEGQNETDDPEAYRMVLQAHHLMRTDRCNEIYQSEQLLQQATVKDPDFAYAWYQLFAHYFKLVYVCGESTENYQKALEMANKVEQLAPGKYQPVSIARVVILTESNQVEAAYGHIADADWNNPQLLNMKVYALRFAGFLDVAADYIDRILQLDPYFYNEKPIYQAPNSLLYLGQYEKHLGLLAEPGNAYHDFYRGLNLVVSGHETEAKPLLKAVFERTPNDLFGRFSEALYWAISGKPEQAKLVTDNIVAERQENQHFDGEMSYKAAQLYALSGHHQAAIEQLAQAVEKGFFAYVYFTMDPALDAIRVHPQFDVIIDKAKQRHLAFAARFDLQPDLD